MKRLQIFVHGSAEMYGSDKVLLNLALSALDDDLLQPVVVLHEHGPLETALRKAGIEVHVAGVAKIRRGLMSPSALPQLLGMFNRACKDLDRVCDGRAVGLVYSNTLAVLGGAFWAWRRNLPHVWHVHEIIRRPAAVGRLLPYLVQRFADRAISNSRQTEVWLLGHAPKLKPRSTVIFNGLGSTPVVRAEDVASLRARLGVVSAAELLVVVAGRLNHWKGQDLLIEAVALLHKQDRLAGLRIGIVGDAFAGHADVRAALTSQVRAAGLEDQVRFLPFVDDVYALWRACDIAVVPSLEPEPFGMVAIEAMACGVPVVAAAHGGLLDIVDDEVTGLLFEPGNATDLAEALHRLARDAGLRARLGAAGLLRQAKEFSLASQVSKTRDLCHQLLPA